MARENHMTKIQSIFRRFSRDNSGVAYLEFALAFPFMLLLFAGSIDVTRMVLLHQKVDKAVFSVGDLATQLQAENGVCDIVKQWETTVVRDMVKPFNWEAGNFTFAMSAVIGAYATPTSSRQDLIEWQYKTSNNATRLGNFTAPYTNEATLPASIKGLRTDERIIVTEMSYTFRPILGNILPMDTERFYKVSYFRSRLTDGRTTRGSGVLSRC